MNIEGNPNNCRFSDLLHITNKDIKNSAIADMEKSFFSEDKVQAVYQQIMNSEARVNFNGGFVESILETGYLDYSKLKGTKNTEHVSNFIQRIHTDFSIFSVKKCNENLLNQARHYFEKDRELFLQEWGERFEGSDVDDCGTVEEVFETTGFTLVSDDDNYTGPIFSCLYHEGKVISGLEEKVAKEKADVKNLYGKSQLIIKKEIFERHATLALGDTFDADVSSYMWKDQVGSQRRDILFDVCNKDNVVNRLRSLPKDSIPYIEAHFNFTITKDHIEKITLSKSEIPQIEEVAKRIFEKYGIQSSIID